MARKYAPNRIRELRKAKGLSQGEVGLRLDPAVAHATIQKLENSDMGLTLDYIQQLAVILDVTPMDIMSEVAQPVRYAPVVGTIAGGNWSEAVAMSDEYLPIPKNVAGPRAFLVRVDGSSMADLVDNGGYALVDPDELDLVDGKPYAVMNESHETTFKQYRSNPPSLVPMTDDPSHQPILIGRTPFVVIGRVRMVLNLTD